MHDRILRFRRANLAFFTTPFYLCATSYFSFDQQKRSQNINSNENNNENQRKAFKEFHDRFWESEHRNDQENEHEWQKSLQRLCTNEHQDRVRMFEIFHGRLAQSTTAKPFNRDNQVNQHAGREGHRQFPLPSRLA